jgi:penicillin-binding protein 2
MPSTAWKLKTQHDKWYAGETISVGIGQGAVRPRPATGPRLGGIASGGVLRRPHVVFPDELPPDQLAAIAQHLSRLRRQDHPLTPRTGRPSPTPWPRSPPAPGTAAAAHLEGIDFAGKTGTAQVMSHERLATANKGHNTEPNAWFVGMAPRRNPDIVVAVLWEHGNWGNELRTSSPPRSSTPSSPSSASRAAQHRYQV